ncbi:hypothetical protein QC761_402440 [Podospora bellae-mahoneyi]|uniref:Uncharacterized protein n=1 Tax=Podospora bellae-mahoneyi TaxID=2093777 RepID=A0ABR0FGE5_9PEZI|nr:hypothetical protein QC761_402440 [Podospora bellae-mahoneyi]
MPSKNASSHHVIMDSEKRTQKLHELDLQYHQSAHQLELVMREEDARRAKVRQLLLQDEASTLKDQITQRDARIKDLVDQADDVRQQLDNLHERCRRQEKVMQTQNREISNLKEEITAFSHLSVDSSKVLTEKLALSRELSLLKPEVEHLKSQLAHQKDVLAEKLALERQLNTLEVELANEKRAAQKAALLQKQQNENQNQEEEETLRAQIRELEKQLAKEKKTSEKSAEVEEEIQGLRGQLAALEKTLATEKKQAAQRENAMAEVQEELEKLRLNVQELEKEKKAALKKAAKAEKTTDGAADGEEVEQLKEELTSLKKALAQEQKETEALRKENEQAVEDAEEQKNALLNRVEKLKNKYKDTVEELKKCRTELERANEQAEKAMAKVPAIPAGLGSTTTVPLKKPGAAKANAKKKRTVDELMVDEKVLMTPGGVDDRPKRPLKKRGFDTSVLVEKSTFSITPFLNKTVGSIGEVEGTPTVATVGVKTPAVATPAEAMEVDEEEEQQPVAEEAGEPEGEVEEAAPVVAKGKKMVEKKTRGRPKGSTNAPKPLEPSSPGKANEDAPVGRVKKMTAFLPSLEEADVEGEAVVSKPAAADAASVRQRSVSVEPEKKKKRKLGGAAPPTIFEEDEGEKVVETAKPVAAVGGVRKRPPVSRMNKGPVGKVIGIGGSGKAFSPLKRDKRGVGASFLA